ncbi:hypothetical protein ACLOJK_005306 [Asimina triloba]
MRLIVPLQGLAQGKRGLILGFAIPCALLLFLRPFLKRNRSSSPAGQSQESSSTAATSSSSKSINASISSRASSLLSSTEFPYNTGETTTGIIQRGLVENQLSVDLFQDWIAKHLKQLGSHDLDVHDLVGYQPFDGLRKLKEAVARVMDEAMQTEVGFDPSQIVLTAGATPAIEILSFCLADPGNAFLVPSPYYPGDIRWRSGVEVVPVPCRSIDNFNPSIHALERAYRYAKMRLLKVCAVLISNPSNPAGTLLAPQTMENLLEFVREKSIHLIADEVSAGSTHAGNVFKSFVDIAHSKAFDMSRVHIVYGLSKDLSLPGFRVGVIYSYNQNVLETAKRLARFCSISIPAQHLLVTMLSDTQFIKDYIQMNKRRLGEAYAAFVNELKRLDINCAESKAGIHCWADMSKLMRSFSRKGEFDLWHKLQNVPKINIIPGSLCHCIEPGWFRCSFATLAENDIPMVLDHIHNARNQ